MDTKRYLCVDDDRVYGCLTKGHIYEGSDGPDNFVHITDNNGTLTYYFAWRFEEECSPNDGEVSRQEHYHRFAIEPLEFITKNKLEFWQGNVIKYVVRFDAKDGIKDLKKARDYLDKEIRFLEGDVEWCR